MFTVIRQIESTEYVDDLFELKSRYGVPMLRQFAELVNREMFWVVTEVCSEHNLVRRSKIIKQFIKIAREFSNLRLLAYSSMQDFFNTAFVYFEQGNARSVRISIPCLLLYLAWVTELSRDCELLGRNCRANIRGSSATCKN